MKMQGCWSIISPKEHHNESYDYENNNKYMQKTKFRRKVRDESVEAI